MQGKSFNKANENWIKTTQRIIIISFQVSGTHILRKERCRVHILKTTARMLNITIMKMTLMKRINKENKFKKLQYF